MADQKFRILGLDYSPIKGPEGNIEYLIYAAKDDDAPPFECDVGQLVRDSHSSL